MYFSQLIYYIVLIYSIRLLLPMVILELIFVGTSFIYEKLLYLQVGFYQNYITLLIVC